VYYIANLQIIGCDHITQRMRK